MAATFLCLQNVKVLFSGLKTARTATFGFCVPHQQKRNFQAADLATYKRGKGGRCSFSGTIVTVFGATGFVGRHVVNRLGKEGSQIIVPYRGDSYNIMRLKPAGDLGQILFYPFNLRDEDSIRTAMKYSNVVINLVGRDFETKNFTFSDVHADGARSIAKIAREMGVKKLIHVSALNANLDIPAYVIKGGSGFLKSKALGELAVRQEFPDVIIVQPSDIFGHEDRFLRHFVTAWRRTGYTTVHLWKKGEKTVKQPVYVGDVARGIVNAIYDPAAVGKTFQFVGPERYRLCDIVDYIYTFTRRTPEDWGYKRRQIRPWSFLFKLKTSLLNSLPGHVKAGWDKIERECPTDVIDIDNPTLADLGVKLTMFGDQASYDLQMFIANAYYEESLGEFPTVPPPKAVVE